MRKSLLIAIGICTGMQGYAQRTMHGHNASQVNTVNNTVAAAAKTTAFGSTETLTNISAADTARTLYSPAGTGSGYVTGTNSFNDMAFAERYTINGNDSSVVVSGVYAQFGGTVNPASDKSVNFKVWMPGAAVRIKDSLYYNGFPDAAIDSVAVPVTQLGIGAADTVKQHLFAAPTAALFSSFFVGYTIAYNYETLNGDTLGLASSLNGQRNTNDYTTRYATNADGDTTSLDTLLNVQNATQWSDGLWYDNYTQNDSIANNLAIYPIVQIWGAAGVASITKNNLTFSGCYPNPAVNSVSISYSLAVAADVTISIMDMNGRLLQTINNRSVATGAHITNINTSSMPAGEYLYVLRTSAGDGIASKLIIAK